MPVSRIMMGGETVAEGLMRLNIPVLNWQAERLEPEAAAAVQRSSGPRSLEGTIIGLVCSLLVACTATSQSTTEVGTSPQAVDTTPPSISISAPVSGTNVNGTVTVAASAFDSAGIAGVTFRLDGASLGPEDTTAPFSFAWDTTQTTDGVHTLTARARDVAGNVTTSVGVNVTISNGGTAFSIGDRVQTAAVDTEVRSCAGSSCTLLGTQAAGAQGSITAGPTFADGVWWWHVDYDANPDGWSRGTEFVRVVSSGASDCSSEGGLNGRQDILHCEPWESADWWQDGYLKIASTSNPVAAVAGDVDRTSVGSTGCVSGSCLRVEMRSWSEGGAGGALALHWPIPGNRQEVHLRYYMKLAPNFSPDNFRTSDGGSSDAGGKFPGLADVRAWPEPQCGNGGAFSDGINCWSGRSKYRDCSGSGGAHVCTNPSATTRIGWYWYLPTQSGGPHNGSTNQSFGSFDNVPWGTASGPCSDPRGLGNWNNSTSGCGKGDAGQLVNNRWYRVEQYVRMNTPGTADGVARVWVDGILSYEKTNVIFREVGHDNLHVRTVWLNIHAGGEGVGPAETTAIYLDQMVVATEAPAAAWSPP